MDPHNTTDPALIWPTDPSFRDFPKRLPQDCVEYTIHVLEHDLTNAALRSRLLEILKSAEELKRELCRGYIWQREGFELSIAGSYDGRVRGDGRDEAPNGRADDEEVEEMPQEAEATADTSPSAKHPAKSARPCSSEILHLHGRTHHGDSIADEWLIVHLLRQLSIQCPQAYLRVWDADGEFLLIEAANELPEWLEPDCSGNRVWINNGSMRIIPAEVGRSKKSRPRSLKLDEALDYLRRHQATPKTHPFLGNPALTTAAFLRCPHTPDQIRQNLHTSILRLPRKLSYLLHRQPQWVSPAIEAFYLRDPVSMRTLRGEARSGAGGADTGLIFPPTDMVDVPVKMQRVGFAQLRGQEFALPKAWTDVKPTSDDRARTQRLDKDLEPLTIRKREETGMKLTRGFEMLLSDPQQRQKREVKEIQLLLGDLEEGEEELPDDAETARWRESEQGKEDSESWLDIDFEAFERELKGKRSNSKNGSGSGEGTAATTNGDATSAHLDTPKKPAADEGTERAAVDIEPGFGDKATQDNLRRMVARFQDYLKTEEEGDDARPTTNTKQSPNMDGEDENADEEDSDASYHPSDEDSEEDDSDELGSSEEEGWGEESDDDEAPSSQLAGAADEEEVPEEELKTMIKEMQEMGIKPPSAASGLGGEKDNKELREALMMLSEMKPAVKHLFPDRKDGAESMSSGAGPKAKGKASMPLTAQRIAKGGTESEDEEIEEVTREMEAGDGGELSSDDEDMDPLDPREAKSFEEMFGRELREAGVLK